MDVQLKRLIYMLVCLGWGGAGYAAPVSDATMQRFFEIVDVDSVLIQTKNDPAYYRQFAHARVSSFVGVENEEFNDEQEKIVAQIESMYHGMDSSRVEAMKNEMFETYKDLFKNNHSEESVIEQIQFMSSPLGQTIIKKQPKRQAAIQQLYLALQDELSQKVELQEALRININK